MSVKHEHGHGHDDHPTSRLQPPQQRLGALLQSHPGLCGTPVGPGKDTHGTLVPLRRKVVGGPTNKHHATRSRQTTRPTFQRPFLGNKHGSGAARRSHAKRAVKRLVRSRLVHTIEAEISRVITKTDAEPSEKRKPITKTINQMNQHIKMPQTQCTDKVADESAAVQRQVSPNSLCTERVGEGDPTSELGLDLRYGERAHRRFVKADEMKARPFRKVHGRKRFASLGRRWFSDLHNTIKANIKIVKDLIWINPVLSEITFQPLCSDTDAPLHDERVTSTRCMRSG